MADEVRAWTDKKLSQMESHITDIYKTSAKGIYKSWNEFMQKAENKTKTLQAAYDDAKQSGDKDLITQTGKKLSLYKKDITLYDEQYQAMIKETTRQLANVNQTALAYINDQMPSIYTNNFNGIEADADNLGIRFGIVDEATVKRLVLDGDIELPNKKLDVSKDMRWNTKQLNSSVLQGILQGESMSNIAKRIQPITNNNKNSAIRNARTMVTGAENRGRLDSYKELQDAGAVLKKVWMATPDSRTRDWHIDMDGQEVDIDEDFIDGLGNELEYPGDPRGAPETVYNCRCTMVTHIIGFKKADGRIERINYESSGTTLHEEQIAAERANRVQESTPRTSVVNGTDISGTWQRRADEFDFEIEDVINAQGFDGLPRVVSAEEFDRYVQAANDGNGFIAQRTYSAPDQETLDMYRDQLYNGKWYVDCSTGGAQYGQGMYCAADYTGTLSDGIKAEMEHYISLGDTRNTGKTIYDLSADRQRELINNTINSVYPNLSISEKDALNKMVDFEVLHTGNWRTVNEAMQTLTASNIDPMQAIVPLREYRAVNVSYIETITLDSSANIISYDEIFAEKQSFTRESFFKNAINNSDYTDTEKAILSREFARITDDEVYKVARAYEKEVGMDKYIEDVTRLSKDADKIEKMYDNIQRMDIGSYAASKGYDAINAEGHGESGSYTVILNRTKVIIKGE